MKMKLFRHLIFLLLLLPAAVLCKAQVKKGVTLNHIALYVKNLQTSTNFYQKVVGLDTIPEPFHDGRHTWFQVAEHAHLHLIQGAKSISDQDKNSHLCFTVDSVEEFIKTLVAANIPYENWAGKSSSITTRVDGVKQIYFQDPDKYWVEINDDRF
jgi:lactoylglutathione lyase